jgi:hypothetical protein
MKTVFLLLQEPKVNEADASVEFENEKASRCTRMNYFPHPGNQMIIYKKTINALRKEKSRSDEPFTVNGEKYTPSLFQVLQQALLLLSGNRALRGKA